MVRGLYTAYTGMINEQKRLDVISNNMANAATVGYKRIVPLNGSTSNSHGKGYQAKQLRITILDSRACPLLSNLNIY